VSKVTTAFLTIGIGFLSVLPFYLIPLSEEKHRGLLRLNARAIINFFASHLGLRTGHAFLITVTFALVGFAIASRACKRTSIFPLLWIFVPLLFATHFFVGLVFSQLRYLIFLFRFFFPFVAVGAIAISE